MSDSSPSIQRKPRRKAPIITTSQDSPKQRPSKKTVPPSPGVIDVFPLAVPAGAPAAPDLAVPLSASPKGVVPLAVPAGAPAAPDLAVPLDTVAAPKPKQARKRSKKKVSRRQQRLGNKFLDLQAREVDSCGDSVEGSENSEDDGYVPPHFSNCSFYFLNT